MSAALLEARLAVERRDFPVEVDLSLQPGERLALFGTSGAGKTTILDALSGGLRLRSGEIVLSGRVVNCARRRWDAVRPRSAAAVAPRDRSISVVRQPTTLFPHLSVAANVGYGLPRSDQRPEVIEAVGLAGYEHVLASRLSGGQRQRVALARAVGRGFRLLLLDEPLSAVDAAARPDLLRLAESRIVEASAAGVLVTHDLAEAQGFGDRLAVIDRGAILQTGPPHEVVAQPANRRVAELCGYTAFVAGPSGRLWALHPERFVPGERPEMGLVLAGTVVDVRSFGPRWTCRVKLHEHCCGAVVEARVDVPPDLGTQYAMTAVAPPIVDKVVEGQ